MNHSQETMTSEEQFAGPEKSPSFEKVDVKVELKELADDVINEGKTMFSEIPNATEPESKEFKDIQKDINDLGLNAAKTIDYLANQEESSGRVQWWDKIKSSGLEALRAVALVATLAAGSPKQAIGRDMVENNPKTEQAGKESEKEINLEKQETFDNIFNKIRSCSLLPYHKEPGIIPYYQGSFMMIPLNTTNEKKNPLICHAYMDDMNLNSLEFFDETKKVNYVFNRGFEGDLDMKEYSASDSLNGTKEPLEKINFIKTPQEFAGLKEVFAKSIPDSEARLLLENIRITLDQQSLDPSFYSLANKEDISNSVNFKPEVKEFYKNKIKVLADHVNSPEYLQKLQKEFGISEEEAREHQKVRAQNILQGDFSTSIDDGYSMGGTLSRKHEYEMFMPSSVDSVDYIAEHEFLGHKAVDVGRGIAPKSLSSIREAMNIDEEFMDKASKPIREKYGPDKAEYIISKARSDFSKEEEIYARVTTLHLELEKLGIVKYGETITKDHIEQLKELESAGKLSIGTRQLLHIINVDALPKLLNEIAENNSEENNNSNSIEKETLKDNIT